MGNSVEEQDLGNRTIGNRMEAPPFVVEIPLAYHESSHCQVIAKLEFETLIRIV